MTTIRQLTKNSHFIEALTATLTTGIMFLLSVPLSSLTGTNPLILTLLCVITPGMLFFFNCGTNRLARMGHIWLYALLLFLSACFTVWMTGLSTFWYILARTLFILICCCLGRYLSGGKVGGLFLIAFFLVFIIIFPLERIHSHEREIIESSAVATGLSATVYTVLITLLPITTGFPSVKIRDPYLFKVALRMTFSLTMAFLVADLGGSSHASWICFSIMVTQGNLGETVKRALERLAGTIAGIVTGTLMAIFLFDHYPQSLYLDFVFLFFLFYFMKHRYWATMIFATLLVTSSYYLFHPAEHSIHAFLFARLTDTLLGIVLCLAGELLIFFRSVFDDLRPPLFRLHEALDTLLQNIINDNEQSDESTQQQWHNVYTTWSVIAQKMDMIKYEPIVYVSRRYWIIKTIYYHLSAIIALLCEIRPSSKKLSLPEKKVLGRLQQFTHLIKSYRPVMGSSRLAGYLNELEQLKIQLENFDHSAIVDNLWNKTMLQTLSALANCYIQLFNVHRFAIQWKAGHNDRHHHER